MDRIYPCGGYDVGSIPTGSTLREFLYEFRKAGELARSGISVESVCLDGLVERFLDGRDESRGGFLVSGSDKLLQRFYGLGRGILPALVENALL